MKRRGPPKRKRLIPLKALRHQEANLVRTIRILGKSLRELRHEIRTHRNHGPVHPHHHKRK